MNLPKGLFIFNYINIKQIENLINYCHNNEKDIDVYTQHKINNPKIIKNIEKKYDYIVIENKIDEIDFSFKNFLKPQSWCCLILSDYDNSNIDILKTKVSNFGFNSLLIPSKKYIIGNEISILYNNINKNEEIYTHLKDGISWADIFKACGFYNIKVNLIENGTR
jgi:tRNA U34 5-carboxymethylaminomethyl modifying GTPase MnmE/TrmE